MAGVLASLNKEDNHRNRARARNNGDTDRGNGNVKAKITFGFAIHPTGTVRPRSISKPIIKNNTPPATRKPFTEMLKKLNKNSPTNANTDSAIKAVIAARIATQRAAFGVMASVSAI